MSDTPSSTPSSSPLPPAPPSSIRTGGCLKFGLIGCGIVILLVIVAGVAMTIWVHNNSDEFESSGMSGVQEGARFGLRADEAGCLAEASRRAGESGGMAAAFAVGGFMRSCLEFSRPTDGFCADVPPPTALRRTIAWQRERCNGEQGCTGVIGGVQTYCAEGQPKRTAADTLIWADSLGAAADSGIVVEGVEDADSAGF